MNKLVDAESDRLPLSLSVRLLRWWIPLALTLVGVVILVADDFNTTGADAFAAFAGAGISIWLMNFLWRLGISGDDERDREALDRVYLAEHGHWPDQPPQPGDHGESDQK